MAEIKRKMALLSFIFFSNIIYVSGALNFSVFKGCFMRLKKGFTLIELLVVIAIIALLLSIMAPSLSKVKEITRTLVCRVNIRSLVLGFRTYVESNDQNLLNHGAPGVDENLWLLEIQEQFDVDKARYCPETKLNPKEPPHTWPHGIGTSELTWIWPYGVAESEYGSYGHNFWLYADRVFVSAAEWESSAWQTANPSNSVSIPLFVDSTWVDYFARDTDTCPADFDLNDGGGTPGILRILINRHRDELNVGFIDGHAEPVKLEMLWSLKWSKDFQTMGVQTRTDGSPIYQIDY